MNFSSGDWIAIAVGSVAAVRWLFEKYFAKSETDEEKVQALSMAFEIYKAAAVEREKGVAASIARIERSLINIQRQMGLLVSGGANKFFEVAPDDRHGTDG